MKILLAPFRYFFIGIYAIFTSKLSIVILVVCLILGILQVSTGYQEELLKREQEMLLENEVLNIHYYYDDVRVADSNDHMAIMDLIECYQAPMDLDSVPTDMMEMMNRLENSYRSDSRAVSFLYHDLFSGFTVSYNADSAIFTASSIKAPAMIYIYEKASQEEIDLNEKLTYTSNFYSGGSGVLKNKKVNTTYTVEELIQYTIYESDNIAYRMLMNRYGRENILGFWKQLGTKNIFELNTIWGVTSANDALIYMKELYRFSKENDEYGKKLLDHFKQAKWKLISDKDGNYNTANKGGWSGKTIHDIAIVFDENPYILIIMSNLGESSYSSLFDGTSKMVGELHESYWRHKVELCSNIKLY